MERVPMVSSNIKSAGYSDDTQTLEIEFQNGVYRYQLVPQEIADEFFKAESCGKYFMANIRIKYFGVKVSGPDSL
jgi:hypothetical protein